MMRLQTLVAGAVLLAIAATATAQSEIELPPATEVLLKAAKSKDWLFRAVACMRLEGQDYVETDRLLDELRVDADWRVRAFAVRAIARRPGGTDTLGGLVDKDPRVIRVALLYGVKPDPETVVAHTRRSLAKRSIASRLLGVELAALGDSPEMRNRAQTVLKTIILNMSPMQAAYVSARIGPACNLPLNADATAWQRWFARGEAGGSADIRPVPRTPAPVWTHPPPKEGDPPRTMGIAGLDEELYYRFVTDYLGELKSSAVEVVVCIDTSGSMTGPINAARAEVDQLFGFLTGISMRARIGLVGYADSRMPLIEAPLSDDHRRVRETLWSLTVGGGDEPVAGAIHAALRNNRWTRDAIRAVVLIGDESYQPQTRVPLQQMLHDATEDGFFVHAIKVNGRPKEWDEVADWGGGRTADLGRSEDLIKVVVSLVIGEGWENEVLELLGAYLECIS